VHQNVSLVVGTVERTLHGIQDRTTLFAVGADAIDVFLAEPRRAAAARQP
jgi:hypothetical protein